MHELSIAQSIVEAVETSASERNARSVSSVRLKVGDASGIVTDSLTFCFEMLVADSPMLTGAHLLIDRVPHLARCRRCDKEFVVQNFVAQCPLCQEWSDEIISGTELQVVEMEIDVPEPGPSRP
jgi:hydrogenase nickel incorporation protein HypA/HybF